MKATFRRYDPQRDFLRVRDLLAETFIHHPLNWTIERWNYARHFVAPLFGNMQAWEDGIGIWEDDDGRIVGVVSGEGDSPGEAHIQTRPGCWSIYPEMLAHAQEHLTICTNGQRRLIVHIQEEDPQLAAAAERMGYLKQLHQPRYISQYVIRDIPEPSLPTGFVIRSMADCNDIERRRRGLGRSFNHFDPKEWASAEIYQELQKAPDYRPDLDLYVVAPGGEFVSSCILWYDSSNRICMLEPVGTDPDYRQRGLGREVIYEGLRRASRLGAARAFVGTNMAFYLAIGFEVEYRSYWWEKAFV